MHGHVIVKESVQVPILFLFCFFKLFLSLQLSDFVRNLCDDIDESGKKNRQEKTPIL